MGTGSLILEEGSIFRWSLWCPSLRMGLCPLVLPASVAESLKSGQVEDRWPSSRTNKLSSSTEEVGSCSLEDQQDVRSSSGTHRGSEDPGDRFKSPLSHKPPPSAGDLMTDCL